MKLVIEIDDETYKSWKEMGGLFNTSNFCLYDSIMNGTPLPKGHGDLIDRNDLEYEKYNSYAYAIANAPTIIEADKED